MKYCAVNARWHEFVTAETKAMLVASIVKYSVVNRKLIFQFPHYDEEQTIGFSEEFTSDEMVEMAIKYLYHKAPQYGWKIYKEI